MRNVIGVIFGAAFATTAFADDVKGYECLRLVNDQQIKCGPFRDGKPQFVFDNVTDLYAKGYRMVASYFVPEHRPSPGSTSVNTPHYLFIIEKR